MNKKLNFRLKQLFVMILMLTLIFTNTNVLNLINGLSLSDDEEYYSNLKIGSVLNPGKTYNIAKVDGKYVEQLRGNVTFYFDESNEILPEEENDNELYEYQQKLIVNNGPYKGEYNSYYVPNTYYDYCCIYIKTKEKNGFEEFVNIGPEYLYFNGNYEDFLNYNSEDNCYYYETPEEFSLEDFLNENDVEKYIVNPIISSGDNWDYYDEYWIKVKTPETDSNNRKVVGWYVSNVVEAGYYNDEKNVYLTSIHEGEDKIVNYYVKTSIDNNYYLLTSKLLGKDDTSLYVPEDDFLDIDGYKFIGWDKTFDTVKSSESGFIDVYAQYGEITKIIKQPEDQNVKANENATFNVEASGVDLSYKWYGGVLTSIDVPIEITTSEFSRENKIYTSTNHGDGSTGSVTFYNINIEKDSNISFDYTISSENNYDYGYFSIINNEGVDIMNKRFSGQSSDTITQEIPAGTYDIVLSYKKDGSVNVNDDNFIVENIKIGDVSIEDFTVKDIGIREKNEISSEKELTINNTSDYFEDGMGFFCVVTGKYGNPVESNYATLNIDYNVLENIGISATYNGPDIKVGNNYDKSNVSVVINTKDYNTGEISSTPTTEFDVNSLIVNNQGKNTFTATHNNLSTTFIVYGADVPLKPENLKAIDITDSSAKVTWEKPKDDERHPIIKYEIYLDENKISETKETQYNLTGLDNTTNYKVKVVAVNDMGKSEPASTSFTTNSVISKIEATYPNKSVLVGESFDKSKVTIKVTYSDNSTKNISYNELTEKPSSTIINKIGYNDFNIGYEGVNTILKIHGYDIEKIEADYKGQDVLYGHDYSKNDVEVIAYYSENYNDKTTEKITDFALDATRITKVGKNTFTATYDKFSDTFDVNGYVVVTGINATYPEESILVGNEFGENKVEITLTYTDGSTKKIAYKELTNKPSSKVVTSLGNNEFALGYNNAYTKLNVHGYKLIKIEAEYKGSDILYGKSYSRNDVDVVGYYSENYNGKTTEKITDFTVNSTIITKVGKNTFTATYNGLNDTFDVNGYVVITNIVATYPNESVLVGDKADKSKIIIKAIYTDGSAKTLSYEDLTNKPETLTITHKGYNEYEISYNNISTVLKVHGYDIEKIEADYKGQDVLYGHDYSKNDVEVIAYYSENYNNKITEKITDFTVNSTKIDKVGKNTFTATYDKFNDNFDVNGIIKAEKIVATYPEESILVGNEFDENKVDITVTYTDNSKKNIKYSELTGKPESKLITENGFNLFDLEFEGLSTKLKVFGYSLESIKATYNGNDLLIGTNYDIKDVSVKAIYTENIKGIKEEIDVKDFNVDSLLVSKIGDNTFTATYENKSDTFVIVGYIEATTLIAKYEDESVFVGEEFDESKVSIEVIYTDGSKENIKYSDLTKVPSSKIVNNVGWNEFAVSYNNLNTNLNVHGYYIDHINASYNGEDILVGEEYDQACVSVAVICTPQLNGTIEQDVVKNFEVDSLLVTKEGENTFIATFREFSDEFTVNGYKKIEENTPDDEETTESISEPEDTTESETTSTEITDDEAQTNDSNNLLLYFILSSLSLLGLFYLVLKRKTLNNKF